MRPIAWVSRPDDGSIRDTVLPTGSVTHTAPRPTATPVGSEPTPIVCTTCPAEPPIRDTVPTKEFATHTSPPL